MGNIKRTIRSKVFETNSSSSHTLTILSKNIEIINTVDIYKDGILNLERIPNINNFWKGVTVYEKLAMVLGSLSVNEDSFENYDHYIEYYRFDEKRLDIVKRLTEKYNISKVIGYYCPNEFQNKYSNTENKTFEELVEIIEDDNIIITSIEQNY